MLPQSAACRPAAALPHFPKRLEGASTLPPLPDICSALPVTATDCGILNGARGAWAFEPLALQLAAAIGIEISTDGLSNHVDREIKERDPSCLICAL